MNRYECKIPAASKGCLRRQLKASWGQRSTYVDVGLSAEVVEIEAGSRAVGRLIEHHADERVVRGPSVRLSESANSNEDEDDQPRRSRGTRGSESTSDGRGLDRFRKDELIAMAEERNLPLTGQETKQELLTLLAKPQADTAG